MVRAKTEEISCDIGAVMWPAKRSNMSGFCINSTLNFDAYTAYLTGKFVPIFYSLRQVSISYDPAVRSFRSGRGSRRILIIAFALGQAYIFAL